MPEPQEELVTNVVGDLVNRPTLPIGTAQSQTVVKQDIQPDELLDTPGLIAPSPTATAIDAVSTDAAAAPSVTAELQDQTGVTDAPSITANVIGEGAQDEVDERSLASFQVEQLLDFDIGQVPPFARAAVREAEARLSSRGVSRSTIAGEAMTAAILQAGIPIAFQDAKVYEQMQQQNLTNKQQAMLSDQAAINAAEQFNAASQVQLDTFFANLTAQIGNQNANRIDAMAAFDATEANKIEAQNAQNLTGVALANSAQEAAISIFNTKLADAREQFNIENQQIIDQSNALWRRSINTVNTAAINAAIQADVQNLLGLSNFALSAIWQQFRDESTWVNENSQNGLNRAHNLAIAALQRQTDFDILDEANSQALYEMMGSFAFNLLNQPG